MSPNRHSLLTFFLVFATVAAFSVVTVSQLHAWTPNGHEKIGEDVGEAGGLATQHVDRLENQAGWADSEEAEDGDGTWGIDEEVNPWTDRNVYPFSSTTANFDHWYNSATGVGKAPANAKRFMGWAAKWYINNGYTNYGFKLLGRGNHYIHDMSVSYHTIAWSNVDKGCDGAFGWLTGGTLDHFTYESWHNSNYEDKLFDSYLSWGADWGADYNVSSNSDIAEQTRQLAHETNPRHNSIENCQWQDDAYPTKQAMYDLGERISSVNEYVAPGHFDY